MADQQQVTPQDAQSVDSIPMMPMEVPDSIRCRALIQEGLADLLAKADAAAAGIVDNASMIVAVEIGSTVRGRLKRLDEKMDSMSKPLYKVWKDFKELHTALRTPLQDRIDMIERGRINWGLEVERRRKAEEEARLAEIKRREEEERRRKAEHEFNEAWAAAIVYDEWWTKERDRKRQEAEDRKRREHEENEARLKQAVAAEQAGELARADIIMDTPTPLEQPKPQPAPVPPPKIVERPYVPIPVAPLPSVTTPEVAKSSKFVGKTIWIPEIGDPKEYILGLSELPGPDMREIFPRIEKALEGWQNKRADKYKDQLEKVQRGVKAVPQADGYIRE